MTNIILWSTDGCHLCEQAIGMFYYAKQQSLINDEHRLQVKDIMENEALIQQYGEKIPVFYKFETQEELGWPITLDEMVSWINR